MSKEFFPQRPESRPTIYAYEDTNPQYEGLLKIGYTTVDAQSRVAQQYPTLRPGRPPYFLWNAKMRFGKTFAAGRLQQRPDERCRLQVQALRRRQPETGINKHEGEDNIGLYDTVLNREDHGNIVEVPELPGCMADGRTYQEAVSNAEIIIAEWIETADELGRPIPSPRGKLMYA
jgi:predicted RNase H-like HicB family nuclease